VTEHADDLAALRANVDQAIASATEVGRALAAHFNALVDAGLTRDEALSLTRDWQHLCWCNADHEDE